MINHKRYFLFSIFYFLFFTLVSAQEASKEENDELHVAKDAFQEGFYDTSARLFNSFIAKYPQSPLNHEAGFYLGQCYFYRKEYDAAIQAFRTVVEQKAALTLADKLYFWIAEAYFKKNDFPKAYEYYDRLMLEYPKSSFYPQSLYAMGWCLFEQDKFKEARERFTEFKKIFPKNALAEEADFKAIECLYNEKEYAALKGHIRSLLGERDFKEKEPLLQFYLGESCFYLEDFGCAIDHYSEVLTGSRDTHLVDLTYMGLGWSYLKSREYQKAREIFHTLQAKPYDEKMRLDALLGEAITLQMDLKLPQALELYGTIISQSTNALARFEASLGKAEVLYQLENYEGAIACYKEAESLSKPEGEDAFMERLHYGLAKAYLKAGKQNDALQEFSFLAESAKDEKTKVSRLIKVADVLSEIGNLERAVLLLEDILKNHPSCQLCDYAEYSLGLNLLSLKRYAQAIALLKTFSSRYPESSLLEDTAFYLGKAYYELGEFTDSVLCLHEFMNSYPSSSYRAQAGMLEGLSLKSLGRFQEAYDTFKAILSTGAATSLVAQAEFEMTECLYLLGSKDEFLRRLELLRSKYQDSEITGFVLLRLAEYYESQKHYDKSRRYLLELIKNKAPVTLLNNAYYMLGCNYENEDKHREAKDFFQKIEENNAVFYGKIGDFFKSRGNCDEALFYYRASLDKEGADKPQIQCMIGECLEELGKPDEALEAYSAISEDSVLFVKGLLRRAKILESQEHWQGALEEYEKVAALGVQESKFALERIAAINDELTREN